MTNTQMGISTDNLLMRMAAFALAVNSSFV